MSEKKSSSEPENMPDNHIKSETIFRKDGSKVAKLTMNIDGEDGDWLEFSRDQLEGLIKTLKMRRYELMHVSRVEDDFVCGVCMQKWPIREQTTCVCEPEL